MTTHLPTTIAVLKPLPMELPARCGTTIRTVNLYTGLPPSFKTHIMAVGNLDNSQAELSGSTSLLHVQARILPRAMGWFLKHFSSEQRYLLQSTMLWLLVSKPIQHHLRTAARRADIVIVEMPYLWPLLNASSLQLRVYNAHDIEYILRKSTLPDSLLSSWLLKRVYRLERKVCHGVHRIITCSQEDKIALQNLYQVPAAKISVIPNGSDYGTRPQARKTPQHSATRLLFLGSQCVANQHAALFIRDTLAPEMTDYRFTIAGGVTQNIIPHAATITYDEFNEAPHQLSSFGLYGCEQWPHGEIVRWTRPRFGLRVPANTTHVRIAVVSFSPQELSISLLEQPNTTSQYSVTSRRQMCAYQLPRSDTPTWVHCATNAPWQHPSDDRVFGVNISSIQYYQAGVWHTASLNALGDTTVYQASNVTYMPILNGKQKDAVLHNTDIALNPIELGSGSNVKLFDYLAAGIPVVTTPFGRRGIAGESNRHFIESALPQFKETILHLAHDTALRQHLSYAGRRLVQEHYTWTRASAELGAVLRSSLALKAGTGK